MKYAAYIAIFIHFARKTVRKISENKAEWERSLAASMETNGIKLYSDMYADPSKCLVGYKGYSSKPYKITFALRHLYTDSDRKKPDSMKSSYEIITDILKHYPSIMVKR